MLLVAVMNWLTAELEINFGLIRYRMEEVQDAETVSVDDTDQIKMTSLK